MHPKQALVFLTNLVQLSHTEVRCGGKKGGCLVCGRLIECTCTLGPAIDVAEEALPALQLELDFAEDQRKRNREALREMTHEVVTEARLRQDLRMVRLFAQELFVIAAKGMDVDGGTIQELGEAAGLLKRVKFDPTVHDDPSGACEPGDDFFLGSWIEDPEEEV